MRNITKKDEWDEIHYPELNDDENDLIRKARRAGYAAFFPAWPDAETQSRRTLEGATAHLQSQPDGDDAKSD